MSNEVLQSFLTFSYWFSYYPGPFAGIVYWAVVGSAGGGVIVGVALAIATRWIKDAGWRRAAKRLSNLLTTIGCLVFLSFLFTQTSTPLLGSRFWFVLWFIIALVWLWYIVWYAIKVAPAERAERAKRQEYEKYLPKG